MPKPVSPRTKAAPKVMAEAASNASGARSTSPTNAPTNGFPPYDIQTVNGEPMGVNSGNRKTFLTRSGLCNRPDIIIGACMSWRIWIAGLLLTLSTSCAARGEVEARTTDELAERTAIFDEVKAAIDGKDYPALNAMAEGYRERRARTPSGTWKLSYFYYGVIGHMPAENPGARCASPSEGFFADWIKADPAAPAPYIAQAWAETSVGLCLRGGAFANQTPPEAVEAMRVHVGKARAILEAHRDVASVDPQYYAEMFRIYQVDGTGDDEMRALLDEAVSREPYYHDLYFTAVKYYLPQWHGVPGDLDRIARFAADHASGDDGKGGYARVFWSLEDCHCMDLSAIDWPLMKQSMHDIMKAYPNDWNAANFARFSCKFSDTPAAAEFFGLMKGEIGADWGHEDEYRRCRQMVALDGR